MSDIIAAIATGRAPCAIGILRLSGPGCAALTGRVFTPKQPFADAPDRRLVLGLLHDRQGRVIDECPRAGLRESEACALCAMADAMYAFAEEDKRCRVVSASVGSVSETYAAPPELCAETIQSREGYLRALAQDYLVFGRYASGGVG